MMSVVYPAKPPRLLEPVRELIRYKHYSLKIEKAYVFWASIFVRRQGRPGVMRQPRKMGTSEVLIERFVDRVCVSAPGREHQFAFGGSGRSI